MLIHSSLKNSYTRRFRLVYWCIRSMMFLALWALYILLITALWLYYWEEDKKCLKWMCQHPNGCTEYLANGLSYKKNPFESRFWFITNKTVSFSRKKSSMRRHFFLLWWTNCFIKIWFLVEIHVKQTAIWKIMNSLYLNIQQTSHENTLYLLPFAMNFKIRKF